MKTVTVTVLGKPACHLCDVAMGVVDEVATALRSSGIALDVEHTSILDDAALEQRYHDDIPVILINGAFHTRWRVEGTALRQAVVQAAT